MPKGGSLKLLQVLFFSGQNLKFGILQIFHRVGYPQKIKGSTKGAQKYYFLKSFDQVT